MPTTTTPNPLATYRITGMEQRRYQASPDSPSQPGGTCDYCGTAIVNCVLIEDPATGDRMVIGTDCAERVGLDAEQVKQLLRERYAAERHARWEADRAAEAEARRIRELELAGKLGEHGTELRWSNGCGCRECNLAAPHGTLVHFRMHDCACPLCLDAALASGERYRIVEDQRVVVDLRTGLVLDDARIVDGRYGSQFRSDSADVWAPFTPPARRTTAERKGVTYAEVPYLVVDTRHGFRRIARLASPIVDVWGEPIVR